MWCVERVHSATNSSRRNTRDKEGRGARPSSPLPAEAIESHVIECPREATRGSARVAEVTERVREQVAGRKQDLQIERRKLPGEIAALSSEGKRLVDTIAELPDAARRLVEERLREVGGRLARFHARLQIPVRRLTSRAACDRTCLLNWPRPPVFVLPTVRRAFPTPAKRGNRCTAPLLLPDRSGPRSRLARSSPRFRSPLFLTRPLPAPVRREDLIATPSRPPPLLAMRLHPASRTIPMTGFA